MINNDVQLFWANNEKNEIVIIFDMAEEDRNNKYTCPVCGSEVKPVAIGGKTKDGKISQVSSHFSHFDASKCSNESAIHYWFKNKILVNGDSFIIKTDIEHEYKCKEVLIEQFYRTEFGIYRPDITIVTECGKTIYFEMNYTNKKKVEDYMDKWLGLANIVVEVDLKALMNASLNKTKYEFKALFYEGKCFNVKKNDLYYNTIGTYKEKLLINGLNEKNRNKIKKLNWFWRDINLYKISKLDDFDLINLFDSIELEEKEFVFNIIKKLKCINVYDEYLEKKIKMFNNIIETSLNDFCNGEYINDYKIIVKDIHRGKYVFNKIMRFINNRDSAFTVEFNITECNANILKSLVMESISGWDLMIEYYDTASSICDFIEDKFEDVGVGTVYVEKGSNSDKYLYKVLIYGLYVTREICFLINYNSIETGKVNNKEYIIQKTLDCDLISEDNVDIFKFINSKINSEVKRYIKKEEKKELVSSVWRAEIPKIRKNKIELFNSFSLRIEEIFKKNPDKINAYLLNYNVDDNFKNTIYFKDYRGKEFVVYDNKSYFHNEDRIKIEKYKENTNLIFIDVATQDDGKIIITETNSSYIIGDTFITPKYNFKKYFSQDDINISFRNVNSTFIRLPRYDFMNAKIQLDKVIEEINILKREYICNLDDSYTKNICVYTQLTDDTIDNKIKTILYPMIYISDKTPHTELNLTLNIGFTKDVDKVKPWLVKDFIESLDKIVGNNINNII